MARAKKFGDGGVTEGPNANIDDDTRARAMAWVKRQQENPDAEEPKAAPAKPAPVKAAAPKPTAKAAPAVTETDANDRIVRQRGYDRATEIAESPAGKAERKQREKDEAVEPVRPEENLIGGPGLKAMAGAAKALASAGGKKVAEKAAESTSRALADKADDTVTFLGKSGRIKVDAPAGRIGAEAKKITGGEASPASLSAPTRALPGPKAAAKEVDEVPLRPEVMDKSMWAKGPKGAKKPASRDDVTSRKAWEKGPRGPLGKKPDAEYKKGGSVRGWGQARGARAAKII